MNYSRSGGAEIKMPAAITGQTADITAARSLQTNLFWLISIPNPSHCFV